MLKKICTGLTLVAGVAVAIVVISRILGKKENEEEAENDDCDTPPPLKCCSCDCK